MTFFTLLEPMDISTYRAFNHGGVLVPLYEQQAQALIDVLQTVLNEITLQEMKDAAKSTN